MIIVTSSSDHSLDVI